ncbi:MAG: metal-dependent hydrolase, partial [Bacteroidetes bacterium]|nr:metal-dependent hydrolase [Bacteroidota bacterium]
MLAPTHSAFGIFLTLIVLSVFGVQFSLHWTIILFAILGSIIPDIDHPHSIIGRLFFLVSVPLERRYGHRTFTHSLMGWGIFSVLFTVIIGLISFIPQISIWGWSDLPIRWIAAFSISYFSHLILDMMNKRGVQMFWPDSGRDVIPKSPKFRPESGSKIELLIFFILVILVVLALPISKYGLGSSLRWLLATPGSAIEEFKSLRVRAYVDFKGTFRDTSKPVQGKAEILDADRKRLVVLYDGSVYTLSDELAADILASNVRVKKTNIPIKVEHKIFKEKTREYLELQIPKKALVSGTIHLPKGIEIEFPNFPGSYKTMQQKGDDLILNFASRKQINDLALSKYFEIQRRKDRVQLAKLHVESKKIKSQIKTAQQSNGLTPLGQSILMSKEEIEKQNNKVAELKSNLEEVNIKIDEDKL